jgi:hypothetical protein
VIRIILLLVLVVLLIQMVAYWRSQTPDVRRQLIGRYWLYVVAGFFILLAATGKLHWIGAAIAAAVPILKSLLQSGIKLLPAALIGRKKDRASTHSSLTARFIRLDMDGHSGQLNGEILEGEHSGNTLSELSQEQLNSLYLHYSDQDAESAQLLKTYIDQRFAQKKTEQPSAANGLSRTEALAILGLKEGATEDQIISAHRQLIQKMHPDRGGNDYLAAKINQAKDLLLS